MIVEVDTSGAVPPYEQIRSQIETMVATGVLAPNDRLPTIRQLAADLGLAPGTVSRAYRELEQAGVVVSRVRHGTRVAAKPPSMSRPEMRRRVREAARAYAAIGHLLGADDGVLAAELQLALVERAHRR